MRSLLLGLVLLGSSSCHTAAAQTWTDALLSGSSTDVAAPLAFSPAEAVALDPPRCIIVGGMIICR